jgi:hypothetical protein
VERRYLVANKIDLIEYRQVDEELGQRVRSFINYSLENPSRFSLPYGIV